MRRLLFIVIAFAACTKQNPDFCPAHPEDPRCGGDIQDAPPMDGDGSNTTTDAIVCLGNGNFRVCFNQPNQPVSFGDPTTIDTTSDPLCLQSQPMDWMSGGQPAACFIIGSGINLPNVNVVGSRPLVLIATGNININGMLDVASHNVGPKVGPGAPGTCMATAEPGDYDGNTKLAGGGGAGGSFFGLPGRNGGVGHVTAAAGGIAAASLTVAPVTLRAGCNGQNGGDGQNGTNTGGGGGAGGGAVYLLAGQSIAFSATGAINASGAGATAGGDQGGGGGGGSGGMIVLYANSITAAVGARMLANGGGAGAGGNNGGPMAGKDPPPATPLTQAGSTMGCGGCGVGGAGAAHNMPAQVGGDGGSSEGGGGGGGGLGYIRTNQLIQNIVSSPVPDPIQ